MFKPPPLLGASARFNQGLLGAAVSSAGWDRSMEHRAGPNAHHTMLWRGGVGKEDQQEELTAVELLKQVLFTQIYITLAGSRGAGGVVLPLLTASGGACRDPAHVAVCSLIAAEMPREFRYGKELFPIPFHAEMPPNRGIFL